MAETNKKSLEPPKIIWLFLFLIGVISTWILFPIFVRHGWIGDRMYPTDWGSFGDMFGALNALFSGLAFSAIAFTLWQQHVDIRIARNEYRLVVKAQRDAASAAEKQNRITMIQMKHQQELSDSNAHAALWCARVAGETYQRVEDARKKSAENIVRIYSELDKSTKKSLKQIEEIISEPNRADKDGLI